MIEQPRRVGFTAAFELGLLMDVAEGALLGQHSLSDTILAFAGIALNRVTRLTSEEYAEEEAARIEPRDGRTLGIHTFNRAGELSVADTFERRPRF